VKRRRLYESQKELHEIPIGLNYKNSMENCGYFVLWSGSRISMILLCTMCLKKIINLTFDHNFGKRRPISKILSLSDSSGNFVHKHYQDCPPHLKYDSTPPCET